MNAIQRIKAEVAAQSERDRALAERIARYLAEENGDVVCHLYEGQAAEIMAMVREPVRSAAE